MSWFRRLFSLSVPVTRQEYAAFGFGLMLFKYAVEAGIIYATTGRFFTPLEFLSPLMSSRQHVLEPPAPSWLPWALVIWSLPFLWIAVSMSVRRAATTRVGATFGVLVLVPLVNFVVMLYLCVLRDTKPFPVLKCESAPPVGHHLRSILFGTVASIAIGAGMFVITVFGLKEYTTSLFFGSPVLMGVAGAFIYNRSTARTLGKTIAMVEMSILLTGAAILLFAAEGAICLLMLLPVACIMGFLGALVGYFLATKTRSSGIGIAVLVAFLPLSAAVDPSADVTPEYRVDTSIEIDAPPERVWSHVIGFTELPPPPEWFFRLGIAYPERARIFGEGVGAIRHCEFSTGPFVEPITAWEPGRRLAFSVTAQPAPMHELSPYKNVHPPHLDGYWRSRRGEFRLIPLPGGRTRLEGSTWYELDLHPQGYWTLWSDAVIHQIHTRVLRHVKSLAEVR